MPEFGFRGAASNVSDKTSVVPPYTGARSLERAQEQSQARAFTRQL